jgi:hypothetical protein
MTRKIKALRSLETLPTYQFTWIVTQHSNLDQHRRFRTTQHAGIPVLISRLFTAHIQNISTQITPAGCSKICLPLPFPKSNQLRILYAFFWVIPRRLNFMCKRFGTPWRTFKISAHRSRQQGAPRSVYHFLSKK